MRAEEGTIRLQLHLIAGSMVWGTTCRAITSSTNHQFMQKSVRTTSLYNLASAIAAFVMWGGWAFYVNSRHTDSSGIVSGLAQGTASFTITLLMVRAITFLYYTFKYPLFKLLLPALLTVSVTSTCLVLIHLAVGTLHIVSTIAPALSVAFAFCLLTTFKLNQIDLSETHNQEGSHE